MRSCNSSMSSSLGGSLTRSSGGSGEASDGCVELLLSATRVVAETSLDPPSVGANQPGLGAVPARMQRWIPIPGFYDKAATGIFDEAVLSLHAFARGAIGQIGNAQMHRRDPR